MNMHGDYVLLEKITIEQKSKGGLVICTGEDDDGKDTAPRIGRVVRFGEGQWDLSGSRWINPAFRVKEGDVVLITKMGDYEYSLCGKNYLITRVTNVIGTLTEEDLNGFGIKG